MQTNLLEYLEATVKRVPEKTAFSNGAENLSFREVYDQSRAIGSALAAGGLYREPVVVFMERHPRAVAAFLGVLYAGCFYVPIDQEMPRHRIRLIFDSLKPRAVLCDAHTARSLEEFAWTGRTYRYEELSAAAADDTTKLIHDTIAAVENGMNLSVETAALLSGVVMGVDEVADIVSSISDAAAEESVAIKQVVLGLDQVSTVVQANSATAEESAAVSHQLADSAKKLRNMVHTFRLKS